VSRRSWGAVTADEQVKSSPLLVWNGLVTRIRLIGAERGETELVSPPTTPSRERPTPRAGARVRDGP
jgi:hypothetical protein